MDKWGLQLDSARQEGLETLFHRVLTVGLWDYGGRKGTGGILKSVFWSCSCLYRHNQQCYGKMEITTGFSSSNWSRNRLNRLSNCRLEGYYGGKKWCWRNFENQSLEMFFGCIVTTSSAMNNWRLPLGSAHWIGLEIPFHQVFDLSSGLSYGGEDGDPEMLKIWRLGTVCPVAPQSEEL